MKRWSIPMIAGAMTLLSWTANVWAQGFLIPTDRRLSALGLKHHRVEVQILDRAAKTKVTQVFVNPTNQLLEAMYIFPLPKGATISDFALYIDGKRTTGQVLVREKAAAIYQSIVRRMQDPGLIEYMGGQLFQARIFPIPRMGEQKIEIAFTQVVQYRGGLHRYVYPIKTSRQTLKTIQDFTMSVDLQSKVPLKNVYSPTHKISLARKGDRRAILGFEQNQAMLDQDFVLYYSVSPKALGINVLSYRAKEEDGYFLMMATPKVSYGSKELEGKNITFVFDSSGSMAGDRMEWAKRALAACVSKLNPKDHFNIVRFSTDVEPLFANGLQLADRAQVQKALDFVKRMEAAGGTAIDEAMKTALEQKPRGTGVNIIIMITDGHPTIGETTPSAILKNVKQTNKHNARIFTFGVGSDLNTKLLDEMAQMTGGTSEYADSGKDIEQRISWFYDKVRYPVLSHISMGVGGGIRLVDVYPKRIPDLFRGGQILVFGRYRGTGHVAVTLDGIVSGKKQRYVFETSFPETSSANEFLPRLWAHRKIAYLLDNIRLHGENVELKGEVIRLAKMFGIVTPYTSYLVVEDKDRHLLQDPKPADGRPIIQTRRPWPGHWRHRGFSRGGANAPSSTARPSPAEPPSKVAPAPPPDLSANDSLKESSGQGAVRTARKLKKMKGDSVVQSQEHTRSRYIKDRLFMFQQGAWVDQKFRATFKTLKVKYLSALYFKILQLRPDLRLYLALDSRITVVVAKDRAIVVGTEETPTSDAAVRIFLQK